MAVSIPGIGSSLAGSENIVFGDGRLTFTLVGPEGLKIEDIRLGVPVEINIENAVAAAAASFFRRFYLIKNDGGIDSRYRQFSCRIYLRHNHAVGFRKGFCKLWMM